VTLILDEVGAAWTRAQVLDVTNNAQNEILGEDLMLTRIRPDPFLATADATYSYVAATSLYDSSANTQGSLCGDVRTVKEIYSYNNSVSIFDYQTLDPSSEKPNQVEYTQTKDRVTMRVDVVDSLGPSLSDCTIKAYSTNNPGVTTTVWRAVAYKWPTQLTAESIALSVPADFQDTLLFFEVLKRLERREYGENAFTFQQAEYYRKKFRRKYNAQATSDLRVAPPRVV
jgi:hypothetical protein